MYCNTNSWCIVANEHYWNQYFERANVFYFILFKSVPSDKKKNPWFKTCIQRDSQDFQFTAWNFFDESTEGKKILNQLNINFLSF